MAYNFTITRGDTVVLTLTVTQNGAVYNLTGSTVRMVAKRNPADLDAAATFNKSSPSTGIALTDAANGIATITLSPSDTTGLPTGYKWILFYDVQVTTAGGAIFTVIDGEILVKPSITETTP
jgi:hypothetical protein